MKKILTVSILAAALAFGSCNDNNDNNKPRETLRVLTFEDSDYEGGRSDYWSSLVDNSQNGGPLLYGDMNAQTGVDYSWYDDGNTFLYSELFDTDSGQARFWNGGFAVSNYVDMTLANGDNDHQLSVYYSDATSGLGGRNGSENFCVYYDGGYGENETELLGSMAEITFGDGVARVIDHMYVTSTTWFVNIARNGGGMSEPMGAEDVVTITAIGYNAAGEIITGARPRFELARGADIVTQWTKWNLSSLGAVSRIKFDMDGTVSNDYGFSLPCFFAIDDVAVRF